MSRLLRLGLIGSLFLVYACGENEETLLLYESVITNEMQATLVIKEQNKNMMAWVNNILAEESKIRFVPIIHTIDTVGLLMDKVQLKIDSLRFKLSQSEGMEEALNDEVNLLYSQTQEIESEVKKGESFKALILGVDDLGERNLNVYRIEVDGQKLSIIDEKYAYYESKPITDDLSFISIKCYVGNDATGRAFQPTGNYRYPIKAY